jgi:hypothetical protein
VATSLIVGANKRDRWSNSVLLESEAVLDRHNTIIGRAEVITHSGALTVGYLREIVAGPRATFGVGASATLNVLNSGSEAIYGSLPTGAMLFVRLRPAFASESRM